MIGPHQPIPNIEIQPVITVHVAMVHVVMHRSIVPSQEAVLEESGGKNLKTEVPDDIHPGHVEQPQKSGQRMKREKEHGERKDDGLNDGLERVK